MLRFVFKGRLLLAALFLLLVPAVLAQDTDYCETASEEIEYGDSVEGEITDDVPFAAYCFDGDEDDEVTVTVETTDGDLVSSVFLADPFLEEVFAEATARNEESESEISFTLPDDGQYLIVVSREDLDEGDTEGEFEMTLEGEGSGGSNSNSSNNSADVENFCEEEPIATLSQFQYGIPGNNPDEPLLTYNVGCTGFLVATVVGRSTVVEYEISRRGEMTFSTGDVDYTTLDFDDDEWVLEVSNGADITLERLEDDGCEDEPLSDLIFGAWVSNDLVFDFSCNGVLLLTNEDGVFATSYEIDGSDINIEVEDGEFILEDFEIDDNVMNAEVDGDALELENLMED